MELDDDDFIFIESADAQLEDGVSCVSDQSASHTASGLRQSASPTTSGLRQPASHAAGSRRAASATSAQRATPKLKRSFTAASLDDAEYTSDSGEVLRPGGKRRRREPAADSDEERWLDALQDGTLEQVDDELRRMRNPQLMTARQRALLEKRSADDSLESFPAEPLLALPSGYREKGEMTAEMAEKHRKKTERRREQAKRQREEEKKRTVSRLLKKAETRLGRGAGKAKLAGSVLVVRYTQALDKSSLSLPSSIPLPVCLTQQQHRPVVEPVLCAGPGCGERKKYRCSRTGAALCSLKCYRANLATHQTRPG